MEEYDEERGVRALTTTFDYFIPINKGGSKRNWRDIALAHSICNKKKSDKIPDMMPALRFHAIQMKLPQKVKTHMNWLDKRAKK